MAWGPESHVLQTGVTRILNSVQVTAFQKQLLVPLKSKLPSDAICIVQPPSKGMRVHKGHFREEDSGKLHSQPP